MNEEQLQQYYRDELNRFMSRNWSEINSNDLCNKLKACVNFADQGIAQRKASCDELLSEMECTFFFVKFSDHIVKFYTAETVSIIINILGEESAPCPEGKRIMIYTNSLLQQKSEAESLATNEQNPEMQKIRRQKEQLESYWPRLKAKYRITHDQNLKQGLLAEDIAHLYMPWELSHYTDQGLFRITIHSHHPLAGDESYNGLERDLCESYPELMEHIKCLRNPSPMPSLYQRRLIALEWKNRTRGISFSETSTFGLTMQIFGQRVIDTATSFLPLYGQNPFPTMTEVPLTQFMQDKLGENWEDLLDAENPDNNCHNGTEIVCPISYLIMRCPVYINNGTKKLPGVFDKSFLETLLQQNRCHPLTRENLVAGQYTLVLCENTDQAIRRYIAEKMLHQKQSKLRLTSQ